MVALGWRWRPKSLLYVVLVLVRATGKILPVVKCRSLRRPFCWATARALCKGLATRLMLQCVATCPQKRTVLNNSILSVHVVFGANYSMSICSLISETFQMLAKCTKHVLYKKRPTLGVIFRFWKTLYNRKSEWQEWVEQFFPQCYHKVFLYFHTLRIPRERTHWNFNLLKQSVPSLGRLVSWTTTPTPSSRSRRCFEMTYPSGVWKTTFSAPT